MPATYTTSQLRDHLADAIDAVVKNGYVDVTAYTTPVARIVPAGHDMAVLERIGGDRAPVLLNIADWTGIDHLPALLDAEAELRARGVDVEYPDWAPLPDRKLTVDELVLLNQLASGAEAVMASPHPLDDWLAALAEIDGMINATSYYLETPALLGLGAAHGYSPAGFVSKIKTLLDGGIGADQLPDVLGDDPLPADLVAATGYTLRETVEQLETGGLPRETTFDLLRAGFDTARLKAYVRAGVTDPATLTALDAAGVHEYFLSRARAEQLPAESWVAVLGPLSPLVVRANYYDTCVVGTKPGLYRLDELAPGGTVHTGRVAWDGCADWIIGPDAARELAEQHIDPVLFSLVYLRISHRFDMRRAPGSKPPNLTHPDGTSYLRHTLDLIAAGVDAELLDVLTLGARSRKAALQCSIAELHELAALRPTPAEAVHLRGGKRNGAPTWIFQLQLWRRFETEAQAFVQMVRDNEDLADFTDWLASVPARELFYGTVNPVRTEAIKVFSGKTPKGARISYLHASELAQQVNAIAYGRSARFDEQRVGQAKRFQHAVQTFMNGVNQVLNAEREALADAGRPAVHTVVQEVVVTPAQAALEA